MYRSKKLLILAVWAGCSTPSLPSSAASSPPKEVVRLPSGRIEPKALNTEQHRHAELFRIQRDHGHPGLLLVVDSWVDATAPTDIAQVRMWWVYASSGRRRAMTKDEMRHLDIAYERKGRSAWAIVLEAGRKRYAFDVRPDDDGRPQAYADIRDRETKATVNDCRVLSARLNTRKLFGAPVGFKSIVVTCEDAKGRQHTGELRSR